jgi:hypothetical protein
MNLDELPIIPHSDHGDKQCSGCLMAVERGDQTDIACNCGVLNTFPGWSSIEADVCRECGEGVVVPDSVQ